MWELFYCLSAVFFGVFSLLDSVWEGCMDHLRGELPEQQFNTWIRPLKRSEDVNDCLQLVAPNRFVLDWVNDKFLYRIEEIVSQLHAHAPLRVHLIAAARNTGFTRQANPITPAPVVPPQPQQQTTPVISTPRQIEIPSLQIPSSQLQDDILQGYVDRSRPMDLDRNINSLSPPNTNTSNNHFEHDAQITESNNNFTGTNTHKETLYETQPSRGRNNSGSRSRREDIEGGLQHKNNLNKTFIFDNFVVGKSNQLGLAAATQVAENPGGSYNPLFIYGGVGLGKTHLMHAVGNALCVRKPDAKVVYLHSERFVADMVKALQLNAINDFKRYYRSVDALLIDDIQFFAGKERSQEEFFHTFNALLEGGQQIILTCDRYPKEINGLEERLKSRFGWGLTVAIEPPELETRVAILKRKAEQVGVPLPNDAAFFLAQRVRSNVRELEGALKRVIANAQFTGRELSVELVREALKDLLALQDRLVSIDNIQKVVAEYYKIKVSDLHAKRRSRSVARPRQVAMYLAKDLTNHSLPEIGEAFGGRDHTTVLHAVRKIKELMETDSDIKEDVKNLLRILTT